MFKRYWIISVVLGLVISAAALFFSIDLVLKYKAGHSDQRQTAAQYQSDVTHHSLASCGAVMNDSGLIGWLTCLADNVSADGSLKQAEYDLNAQQDMAAWALGMLIATIWIAVITLFGVYFVWRTLKETRGIGMDQSRAYIHAEKAFFFWGGEKQDKPRVEVWVQNTGQTPAHWYEIRLKEFVYDPKEIDHDLPILDQIKLPDRFDGPWNGVPSGGEGRKSTFFFKEGTEVQEIARAGQDKYGLSAPSHGFSIVGEIRYKTFFGEIFVSQFAFGRAFLPAYQIKETRTREVDIMTINDHIEEPIPLARYAAQLKTYERQN